MTRNIKGGESRVASGHMEATEDAILREEATVFFSSNTMNRHEKPLLSGSQQRSTVTFLIVYPTGPRTDKPRIFDEINSGLLCPQSQYRVRNAAPSLYRPYTHEWCRPRWHTARAARQRNPSASARRCPRPPARSQRTSQSVLANAPTARTRRATHIPTAGRENR